MFPSNRYPQHYQNKMAANTLMTVLLLSMWCHSLNSEYIPPGPRYSCPKETDKQQLIYPCVCEKGTDDGLYIRCSNTGLATLSVGLGNIAGMGMPIEKLTLKECHISHIFGSLLHRSVVRVLRIEDTPVKAIDQYTFAGINRTLQELHLVNTRLQHFPKDAFKILGNLSLLYIDGHEMRSLDKDIFSGSEAAGRLERLHIINGLLTEIPVEPFPHLKKLKTLDLHGNKITALKKNQFKGLRDTELLDLSFNNLTKVEGAHLGDLTKLGWCNISNNNIAEITRGMFARNTVLKVLHLNGNQLKKLDTNSFRGLRFLRRLYLQDNKISDVGRGTFGTITRIGTVDLARNLLTKVDYQMFYQVRYVEIINLSSNKITLIEKQAFTDLYLTSVDVSNNQLTTIEPGAFENCNNLTLLDFSRNNLTDIPKLVFDVNSYAFEFKLAYNGFTDLSQVPIQNMAGIRILNVSHNQIHTIPKATFPKLYELHTVDVSYNELKDIASAVFQTLFSLRFLYLGHNALEVIRPGTFGTIHTVLELDLSHNQLRDVARGSLAKFASCRTLDISHNYLEKIFQLPISLGELNFAYNRLSEIHENTWPPMNALLRLNLSNNQLGDSFHSESFRGLLTLQSLDLSNNGVSRPPWEALSGLSSLQYLYLKNNSLTSLNKAAFGRLPIVFELDLSSNAITEVSERAFDGLLQLLKLSLSNNSIKHIPNEAFKGLVSLRTLDLSYNSLEKIDNKTHGLLDDCLSLEMVNLSHNSFSFLTKKMFPSNIYIPYKLSEVDLSYNAMPVLTLDITHGTKKMTKLRLNNNNINDIRKHVLGNLTAVEVLDLTGNALKDLHSRTAEAKLVLPPKIRELYLSDNKLEVLPVEQISEAKDLSILDLRNNQLDSIDRKVVQKIKNQGLEVYFEGNRLKCDCFIRPLKHYLNHLPPSTLLNNTKYSNLTCHDPVLLEGENLVRLDEERLVCSGNIETEDKMAAELDGEVTFDYATEPDLAFRDVQFAQTAIYVQWYILSSKDVADFYVFIRDHKNTIYSQNDVAYSLRSLTITFDDTLRQVVFNKNLTKTLELCVQTKDSEGFSRQWHASQCRPLPDDFESLRKGLNLDKRRLSQPKKSRSWGFGRSNVLRLVSDSILITLCIFLGCCFRKLCDFDF